MGTVVVPRSARAEVERVDIGFGWELSKLNANRTGLLACISKGLLTVVS